MWRAIRSFNRPNDFFIQQQDYIGPGEEDWGRCCFIFTVKPLACCSEDDDGLEGLLT